MSVLPWQMSGAAGGTDRHIGDADPVQVNNFVTRNGLAPRSRLDIRDVPGGGLGSPVWSVDPGIMWVWHALSRLGVPLSVAGLAHAQVYMDLGALALAIALGWRLAGPSAGALAGLLYISSELIAAGVLLLGYYHWNIAGSLLVGHLLLSAMTSPRFLPWWIAYCGLAAALVWLRAVWLPVAVATFTLPFLPGLRKPGQRVAALLVGLLLVAGSFAATVIRVKSAGVGEGTLLPRSQLWHTLYIGLGTYGNFGDIRWDDSYAASMGAKAGFPRENYRAYEDYMRQLFLREIAATPIKYVVTIARRYVDYVGAAAQGWMPDWPGSRGPWPGLGVLAFVLTGLVGAGDSPRGRLLGPTLLYALTVAVWALVLPPMDYYAGETLGLSYPVLAAAVVVVIRRLAQGARRASARLPLFAAPREGGRAVTITVALLMAIGALVCAYFATREWQRAAVLRQGMSHPVVFARAADGRAPAPEELFPSTTGEYLLMGAVVRKSPGVDTLVLEGLPAVLAGKSAVGVLDVKRNRWVSPPVPAPVHMLDVSPLPDRARFRVVIMASNSAPTDVRLAIGPVMGIQRRRGVPVWVQPLWLSILLGSAATVMATAGTQRKLVGT